MQKVEITKRIQQTGAMAIVRVETKQRAFEIAQGCLSGGIDCLEISYTLANAGEIIRYLRDTFKDDLLVGAGTVLDSETARLAILAGAQFIIAPNVSKEVAIVCNTYQIPYAPGCSSISEAVQGLQYGAAFIKAFPISDFYGPKLVSVFKTPISNMPILASGGITLANLHEYVANGVECCGFGGLLTKGDTSEIAANAKAICNIISQTRKMKKTS